MKLSPIRREDIFEAAADLDGSAESFWSEYWIYVTENNREYPFKQLVRKAYIHATGQEIGTNFFQSNDGYRQYIEKKFNYAISFKVRDNISFFAGADLELFSEKAGKPYQSTNPADQLTGQQLRRTIFSKTNTWARALNLDDFEIIMDNSWQQRGYFSKYSWARLFKEGDRNKKIFFTVGVSAGDEALVYKLDCQYRSHNREKALTPAQIDIFNRIVKATDAKWKEIPSGEFAAYDWESLIEMTRNFILHYSSLYDEVIHAVWQQPVMANAVAGPLREQLPPNGIGQLPLRGKQFAYNSNPDYDNENKKRKETGDAGEALVIQWEKTQLINLGRPDLADAVRKVMDWEGYDILSFHSEGEPRYIEVKTTTGTEGRPFYWTTNEKQTMLNNPASYCLYRLYNYDSLSGTADFYKLEGDISALILEEAVRYLVYIR